MHTIQSQLQQPQWMSTETRWRALEEDWHETIFVEKHTQKGAWHSYMVIYFQYRLGSTIFFTSLCTEIEFKGKDYCYCTISDIILSLIILVSITLFPTFLESLLEISVDNVALTNAINGILAIASYEKAQNSGVMENVNLIHVLWRFHKVFAQCWHASCFFRKFLCFRFSRSLKANGKVMSKVRTIAYVCCSKYYQTDFCY